MRKRFCWNKWKNKYILQKGFDLKWFLFAIYKKNLKNKYILQKEFELKWFLSCQDDKCKSWFNYIIIIVGFA